MKIGIDLDEVVVGFMDKFCEFYNSNYDKSISMKDFEEKRTYNLSEVIGGTEEEAIKLMDKFYDTSFFDEIELFEGVKEALYELHKNHELFFITSRPKRFQDKTNCFFDNSLPNIFPKVIFSGDLHTSQNKNKSEICNELGIKFIVEDNKSYALGCAEKGVKVFLLDKPWNQDVEHGNIIRVNNWKEILERMK